MEAHVVLGNRLTMHSPSRGFSMELGASITVVLASYLGLPVSSTQSITGATLAVGLCNGDWKGDELEDAGLDLFLLGSDVANCRLISGMLARHHPQRSWLEHARSCTLRSQSSESHINKRHLYIHAHTVNAPNSLALTDIHCDLVSTQHSRSA